MQRSIISVFQWWRLQLSLDLLDESLESFLFTMNSYSLSVTTEISPCTPNLFQFIFTDFTIWHWKISYWRLHTKHIKFHCCIQWTAWVDHLNIWQVVKIIKLLIVQLSPPLGPNICLGNLHVGSNESYHFVAVVDLRKLLNIRFFFQGRVSIVGVESTIRVVQWRKGSHGISSWLVEQFLNCNIKSNVFVPYAFLLPAGDKSNGACRQIYSLQTGLMGGYVFCFICRYAMAFHLQISPIKNYDLYTSHIHST